MLVILLLVWLVPAIAVYIMLAIMGTSYNMYAAAIVLGAIPIGNFVTMLLVLIDFIERLI